MSFFLALRGIRKSNRNTPVATNISAPWGRKANESLPLHRGKISKAYGKNKKKAVVKLFDLFLWCDILG